MDVFLELRFYIFDIYLLKILYLIFDFVRVEFLIS